MNEGDRSRPSVTGRGAAANPKNRRIRSMRGGRLNDPEFGSRMKGGGVNTEHVSRLFGVSCRRAGIEGGRFPKPSTASFRNDDRVQPGLFD